MADLADQLGWCSTSKTHLQELSYVITNAENTLNDTINMLERSNFSDFNKLLYPLQEKYQQGSNETQKFIADHHISYLEDRIKFIGQKIDELGCGN